MSEKTLKAFCFRSGEVRVESEVPARALLITSGPAAVLPEIVDAHARHAYSPGLLLVPGVPEASNDDEALDAVENFRSRLNSVMTRRLAATGGRDVSAN